MQAQSPELEPGTLVDHYRVVRLVGTGGMGQVYLARDTLLGRKVALKLIRRVELADEAARKQFLFEAQATASFSHPHIVTVFGAGEWQGAPYVALEFLEGQSLRERIDEHQPSVREAIRLGADIAEALREAHAAGILHRDLKPQNVLLPRDGRLRVVDFGLARRVGDASTPPAAASPQEVEFDVTQTRSFAGAYGTPAYMAPEQWLDRPSTPAIDVWAFGLILHELVYGSRPFARASSLAELETLVTSSERVPAVEPPREVLPALRELVAQCLAKDHSHRPSFAEIYARLDALLQGKHAGGEESPFRGLLPFTERHAGFFFGRDGELAVFLERLRQEAVLPVVGPSGAGKSSFVLAGVVPRLREQTSWSVLAMRPGSQPFRTLAHRLLADRSLEISRTFDEDDEEPAEARQRPDAGGLAAELMAEPRRLGVHLGQRAARDRVHVLLFVDQLEELYTHVADDETRRRFMMALCSAVEDPEDPVRVCFAVRDDFLVRLAEGQGVAEALSRVFVLRTPGPEALRQILERPVAQAGYAWEDPDLVTEILGEVRGEPACLPLLGFATHTLWEQRDRAGRKLPRARYHAMGGVAGALASHADGVLSGLTAGETRLIRELLLKLVTAEGTRRVLPRGRVLEGLDAAAQPLLMRLIAARLLSVRKPRGSEREEPELELAHESLLKTWRTLARWIDESREEINLLAEVGQAADLWIRRGRRAEELWRGTTLDEARRSLARVSAPIPAPVAEFLRAGEELEARGQRRRRLLAYGGVAALALVTVAAVIAAFAIADREQQAQRGRTEARRRSAEAEREAARASRAGGDLLTARARLRAALEIQDDLGARGLWRAVRDDPTLWRRHLRLGVRAITAAEDLIAVGLGDGTVALIDPVTSVVRPLAGAPDQILSVAFGPDGSTLGLGTIGGLVEVWNARRDVRLRQLLGHTSSVLSLAFSPDGRTAASGANDLSVRLWDLASGGSRVVGGWKAGVCCLAFSPDSKMVAALSYDRTIRLIDVASGQVTRTLGRPSYARGGAFTPDGTTLITGHADGAIAFWNVVTGELVAELPGNTGAIQDLRVSGDGRHLIFSGLERSEVAVWDVAARAPVGRLEGRGRIEAIDFAPDSRHVVSAGFDNGVQFLDMQRAMAARAPTGHEEGAVNSVVGSPDGLTVYSAGDDGTIRQWDVASGAQLRVMHIAEQHLDGLAIGSDGRQLACTAADRTVRLVDAASGVQRRILYGHSNLVRDLATAGDAPILVTASSDKTARVWEMGTGRDLAVLTGHPDGLASVAITNDGKLAATGSFDRTIRLWEVSSGRQLRLLLGHTDEIHALAFAPDGRTLASGSHDRSVRLWDVATGAGRELARAEARITRLAFSPDGTLVAAASPDGRARVFSARDGALVVSIAAHPSDVNDVAFTRDGRLITAGDEGTVRLWRLPEGTPLWHGPTAPPLPAGAPADVTAMVTSGGRTALGYRRGALVLEGSPVVFSGTELTAVSRLAFGPRGTLIAGYADGALGVWDTATGGRLDTGHIHGPVVDIAGTGNVVRVTSDLGDSTLLDLGVFSRPYCDLLHEVWAEVPVALEEGRPVARPPPRDHVCARE